MTTTPRSRRVSTPLELKLFDALVRISSYERPHRLHQRAPRDFEMSGDEAIEIAYENIIEEARSALKGVRVVRKA